MSDRCYSYNTGVYFLNLLVILIIVSALVVWFFVDSALTAQELIDFGYDEDPSESWLLASGSFLVLILFVFLLLKSSSTPKELILTNSTITIPGAGGKSTTLRFSDISKIKKVKVRDNAAQEVGFKHLELLIYNLAQKHVISVNGLMLNSKEDFDEIVVAIEEKIAIKAIKAIKAI